jgi:hypothetical protein
MIWWTTKKAGFIQEEGILARHAASGMIDAF